MNKTKIDWPWKPLLTWNPVVGCRRGCSYCYAKKISDRFKMIPDWTEPQFFPKRLEDPYEVKKSSTIFVGSMCDLFGTWVNPFWINKIINVCRENPHHEFMFLTKNPVRYANWKFPENCRLGATVTGEKNGGDWPCNLKNDPTPHLHSLPNPTFISIEPLLGSFFGHRFDFVDQIIVGAMSGPGAVKPRREWIESIKHDNIYYKQSIRDLYPEFSNQEET